MSYRSFDQLRQTKGLKLLTVNSRSLEKKTEELYKLAHDIDYICISETWFNETIPSGTVNMPGMALFRTDRPNSVRRRGGGVACYVKYIYACYTILCPELCRANTDLEAVGILTKYPGHKQRIVITVYKRPKGNTKAAYKHLTEMLNSPIVGNSEVWLLGDFNVNTRARNSTKYKYMTKFLRKHGLTYLKTGPTHYHPVHGPSTLDHVYTNCPFVNSNGLSD